MAWTTKSQIITNLSVQGTEQFSGAVDLLPGELAVVQVKADFPTTPADNLVVRVYTTQDAATETWDNQTAAAMTLTNTKDPAVRSFPVSGCKRFKIGVVRDGTTDTITVDAWVSKDSVDLGA
jgi:type II secretory pathway pseudopilin PulG